MCSGLLSCRWTPLIPHTNYFARGFLLCLLRFAMTGQFKAAASVLPGRSRQRFVNFRFLLVACFTGLTVTFHGLDIRSASDTFAIPWQLRVFVAEAAVKRKRVLHAVRDPVTGKVIYPDKKLLSDNTKTAGSPASYAPPIPQLDKASFSSFLDERGQVLVYFYGDERCAKCKATGPEIEDINRGLVKYFFSTSLAQVDVSKHPELAEDQDVTQVPALVFYAEGSKSVPEQYRGKLRANRVFDWLRRQDGSFYRDLAAVRRQQKAPMSVDDEERILKKAAANSPFTTVISYTVPGSPKDKLIKAIAHEGDAMRGTLFHFIPVADFKKSKIEIYKAKLPYDLYEDEDIIDYAAQKWSKNEIKRSIYAAFDRTIYPDTDEYVDNLAKTKALATILHDDKTSDYQEYVDVLLQYARDLKDKVSLCFLCLQGHLAGTPVLLSYLATLQEYERLSVYRGNRDREVFLLLRAFYTQISHFAVSPPSEHDLGSIILFRS
ncbi:thioredoxin domain-containing protein [Toxoplasma gondii ARI]|uniref:Thioredoxin domain-containing protein n=1 Tax=Toxoplasma gondii ARI TaxID=1074872 RepID=A0A139YAJ7_TOXGO|nr:thioredoxin domain-containing protein [Toxoplasma gondii ARI]